MDSPRVVNRLQSAVVAGGALALTGIVLFGCGLLEPERIAEEASDLEARLVEARQSRQEGAGFASVRMAASPYLAVEEVEAEAASLPEDLRAEDGVVIPLGDRPSAETIASRIEEAVGVGIRFVGQRAVGAGTDDKQKACLNGREEWLGSLADELVGNGGIWIGGLDELLDAWTRAEGFEWRFDDGAGRIEVVRSGSRIFAINALVGKQTYNSSTSTSGVGGGDTTGAAQQSITSTVEYDPWKDIAAGVSSAAGSEATAVVSASAATVTVSGCPGAIARVKGYLDHLNREVLRPIVLSVHLYSVKFDRDSDFEVGLSGLLPKIFGSDFEVGIESGTISIVKPSSVGRSSLDATVSALNVFGSASRVTSVDIPTLNGRATQFYDLFDHSYLREITSVAEDGVTRVSLTPGTVWSGFGISYVGRIVGPDEVLARITATIQDVPGFTVFGPPGNQIQLPSAGRRAIIVEQRIGRGETLLLTGFANRESSETRGGTFSPFLPLPEGERRSLVDRTETVLLVTAEIGSPMGVREFRHAGAGGAYEAVNDNAKPERQRVGSGEQPS